MGPWPRAGVARCEIRAPSRPSRPTSGSGYGGRRSRTSAGLRAWLRVHSEGATASPRASTKEGRGSSVAAHNRLTVEQIAALEPGDTVTIESAADFGKPRHAIGTVVRLAGTHIVVSCKSPRGVRYVHHFARRDGVRIGGGPERSL
jgi:hypothetical protein